MNFVIAEMKQPLRKIRLHIVCLFGFMGGFDEMPGLIKRPSGHQFTSRRERVELFGAADFFNSFVKTPLRREKIRIAFVREMIIRIKFERAFDEPFGFLPVPIFEKYDKGENRIRLAE